MRWTSEPPPLWLDDDVRTRRGHPVEPDSPPSGPLPRGTNLGVPMSDFIASAQRQPPDLVQGMVPDRGLVVIGGKPRTFKSFLAVQLLLAVATSTQFLGRMPSRTGSVLYVSEEGAHGKVAERFDRASRSFPSTNRVRILHRVGTTLEDPASWSRVT